MIKIRLIKESSINETTDWWDEKFYDNERDMLSDCISSVSGSGIVTVERDDGKKKFYDYIVTVNDIPYWEALQKKERRVKKKK